MAANVEEYRTAVVDQQYLARREAATRDGSQNIDTCAGEIRRDVDRPQDGRKPVIRDDQDIRAGAETAAVEFSQDQPEVVIAAFDRRERLGRSGAIGMLRTVGLGQPQEGEVGDTIPPQYVEQGVSGPRVAADFVFGVGGWTVGGREGPKGRGEGGLQPRWHGGALVNDR